MIIQSVIKKIYRKLFYTFNKNKFAKLGRGINLYTPLVIDGKKFIYIGEKVTLSTGIYLAASKQTGNTPKLLIDSGTRLGNYNHIYATKSITIEKNVLTAERVYISDNLHSYENINLPIIQQPIKQIKKVVIGEGSWLGENVCVIGASVGKNCVIGANSVVTKDIPDYCVAVGSPARIIKKYSIEKKIWEKV